MMVIVAGYIDGGKEEFVGVVANGNDITDGGRSKFGPIECSPLIGSQRPQIFSSNNI